MAGRLKVFLGMAAGVGKTYRMLQEGQAEAESGRDVAIGWLESHGRRETAAQAVGLEVVPRLRVEHRGTQLEEMDLRAILRRAPELCLIDELAHTNAPGSLHPKRFEDVAAVLAAGIDVSTTVNVQHLESLNDQVAELTATRVRETVPDEVLAGADELVLIDLTPEALIERLRAGKVYPAARVESALNNFFKIEHLSALREVALRQVAEEVEAKRVVSGPGPPRRRDEERVLASAAPAAIGERLLALVEPTPASQRVVRRAWRSAQRLGTELDLLWVQPPGSLDAGVAEQLDALRRLAVVLGAHLLIEPSDDLVGTVRRIAHERGTTYVLIGEPSRRGALQRLLRPSLPSRLLEALPGIDVRIVADRTRRAAVPASAAPGASPFSPRERR
ncbi:histidine kinase [Conexibacter sp. JD483]|uniref:histidine kinase n=1 Tax=unclassified Conexibacter TaxID=2627773 RepID=UPI00272563FF|nr:MULTISPECIES: histidine kinase [unclassified Conexibacter]MDO8189459.1 histidine kinase [Conexibacter sp. CPCC 205706]MDO8201624.1 histidine kinase [Conexibacter sp. CPCC 205762]MDR9372618.1 histidine kinase [Conexibacter sp. JD483]